MLKSEARELIGLLQYFQDWEVSPSLKAEIGQAISFYSKELG